MEPRRQARSPFGAIAVLAALALAACNSLTGADRLVLGGPFDSGGGGSGGDDDDDGPGDPDPGGTTAGAGAGSTTGAGASHPGGSDDPGGTTTSTTTTTTTTSTTTSTSSGGPVDCDYPDGGFGVNAGNYVQGNLAWQGYTEGSGQTTTLSIQDYFDCDGSKGINALLIINSAEWCGVCQEEATDLPSHAASFASKGIRVLTLMVENNSGAPATTATATSWRSYFGLEDFATAADPNFTFAGFGSVGLPLQILVDPRTMKIVDRTEGFGDYSAVTQLASQNAN